MKKLTQAEKSQELTDIIKKWKLNIPLLAKTIGIPLSVFKNKLYQSQPSYYFNDLECITILCVLSEFSGDIKKLTKAYSTGGTIVVSNQKVTNYPEN